MLDQQFANVANLPFISMNQCSVESKNRNKKKKKEKNVTVVTVSLLVVESSLSYTNFHIIFWVNATKYTEKLERYSTQLTRTCILGKTYTITGIGMDYRYELKFDVVIGCREIKIAILVD